MFNDKFSTFNIQCKFANVLYTTKDMLKELANCALFNNNNLYRESPLKSNASKYLRFLNMPQN